jgi:GNAT superfamily N-acetyltransferase
MTFAPSRVSSSSTWNGGSGKDELHLDKPARCLILFNPQGIAAGIAIFLYNYNAWRGFPGIYLEDLFVREGERGKGYGKLMMVELAKEVVAIKGGKLEWGVLKWNKSAIQFYEGLGGELMSERVCMGMRGEPLVRLAGFLEG